MDVDLKNILKNLDLTDQQVAIYSLILSNKRIKISEIAVKLATNRVSIYRTLQVLQEKGLLDSEVKKDGHFTVKNPTVIASILKKKQLQINQAVNSFDTYLPDILTNFNFYDQPSLIVYEGKDKFWMLFNSILDRIDDNSIIRRCGSGQDFYNIIDLKYWSEFWMPKRIKKNVHFKILAKYDDPYFGKSIANKNDKREWKFLPPKLNNLGSFWVVADIVIFWDTVNDKAFEIKNSTIANLLSNIFEYLWETV